MFGLATSRVDFSTKRFGRRGGGYAKGSAGGLVEGIGFLQLRDEKKCGQARRRSNFQLGQTILREAHPLKPEMVPVQILSHQTFLTT